MKVRVPKQLDPPEVKRREDNRIRQVRHYRLITPLFGGGVEPNRADPITVVRGTEVRGQLRFWWRATRGGQFNSDLGEMRGAEEAIWGSAAAKNKPGPSSVSVSVKCLAEGTLDRPFEVSRNRRGRPSIRSRKSSVVPAYVAFPLQPKKEEAEIGMETDAVRVGVEFVLEINYPKEPKVRQGVEAALWAWETFGGLGARTRRGFGALQLVAIDEQAETLPACDQIQAWVSKNLKTHVTPGQCHQDVAHVTQNSTFVLVPVRGRATPVEAWRYLVDRLKKFRQDRYPDRGGRPYGRSKWPEPDQVRRLTGTHDPRHTPCHPVHQFPRGQFGLPIIFHFKFKDERRGDPPDSILEGASSDRFASPLILRPLACADGAVGLALRLETPKFPPGGYVLKSAGEDYSVRARELSKSEATQIEPLDGEPDVLQAFLDFLKV
jgi:CRISPR-associated protein Cmr1